MDQESEKAIKLIQVNAQGKYILSQEGRAFIAKINGPIAVISVAGMYRTGKSYLLNRMLLNRSNGFGVGPTVNPCTKGLWCWGKTITGKTAQGQSINVIVIDTEGIGALDEDQTHDTRIFTLAILAASSFIYNSTGSIDQNALQNLSLVVNLTKNIQLNTKQSEQDQNDPEELAEYFPTFHWVVRDFSLQLINSQGDTITPKEYLERALSPQKGFSDDVEQKNRIRRLLSSFFKQRQCFTLVRPVVDEKKLQLLDSLDMDQLRPEFVDQVMNFRRRVLMRVKPKLFKGKQLDGPMYLCLLQSYVQAINNGAVPNIQNAWNYMCQEKCTQAFQGSLSFFNEQCEKIWKGSLPTQDYFLLKSLKEIEEKSITRFEQNSVGDRTKFYQKELREKLQQKIQGLRAENEQMSEIFLRSNFRKSIVVIENKIKSKQFSSFEQFNKQLNSFYLNLLESTQNLPKKEFVYLDMLKKVISTAAEIFLREKGQEFKSFKSLAEQKVANYQQTIEGLKKQMRDSEESNRQKLTKMDRKRVELEQELQNLIKRYEQSSTKFAQTQKKFKNEIRENLQGSKKREEILNERITALNDQLAQLQNEGMTSRCEQEKELALITLKNKQLQTELQQIKKKQCQTMINFKNLQFSSSQQVKSIKEEYQQKVRQRQVQLRQLKAVKGQVQEQFKSVEVEFNDYKVQKMNEMEKIKATLIKKESELAKLIRQKEENQKQLKQATGIELQELQQKLEKYSEKYSDLQKQFKLQSEQSAKNDRTYQKQLMLLKQKLDFAESEGEQLKNQLSKTKRDYQQKIVSILEETASRENINTKIEDISEAYETKISQLKQENQSLIKKMATELEAVNSQLLEVQAQAKAVRSKLTNQNEQYKLTIEEMQEKIDSQKGDVEGRLEDLKSEYKKKEKNWLQKISKLEEELEETKQQMAKEQREEHDRSQQMVLQIKNYYEIEKEKLENKIALEKEKYERKLADFLGEAEQKYKEELAELQNDRDEWFEKTNYLEEQLSREKANKKMELDIKNRAIENLERTIEQIKGKIDNKEVELLNKIERLQKQQSTEKEQLYNKIEQLLTNQSRVEKEKSSILHAKQQIEKLLQQREATLEEIKHQFSALKQKVEKDKQNQKVLRSDISTKLMQERVEFEKKIALLSQENEYLKQKIEQNEKSLSSYQTSHQQKARKIKQEYLQELKAVTQKFQAELEALDSKYQKLKKSAKEKQMSMQKLNSQLEKQLAISNEKFTSVSEKLKIYQEKQANQNQQFSSQFASLKNSYNKQKEQLRQQLENQQKERQRIEAEKNEVINSYQQEKMLLENKNKYLEDGKQKLKQDYEETKNKLEQIIQNSRKKWTQEKANLELTHSDHLSRVEKKFWQQKHDMAETMKKQEMEYENKLKALEMQNRSLNEKLANEEQNKMGSQNISERRVKQLLESEKKLQAELERLRENMQGEQAEIEKQQKEKQTLKQKLKQKQTKYLAMQKAKQHSFYEFQKERAKWKIQKESISHKAEELKDTIMKLQKQIEKCQRENEKLKVERKCQKTSMQSVSKFGTNYSMLGSKMVLDESVLKENINNTSHMSSADNSLFFKD